MMRLSNPLPDSARTRSRTRSVWFSSFALGLALSAFGCGGNEGEQPDGEVPRVVIPSSAPPPTPPPEVDAPAPPAPMAAPTPDPIEQIDRVPEEMADIPMPKNMTLLFGQLEGDAHRAARFEGDGDPNEIVQQLKQGFEANGWAIREVERVDDVKTTSIFVTKGARSALAVAVEGADAKTRVEITVTDFAIVTKEAEADQEAAAGQ